MSENIPQKALIAKTIGKKIYNLRNNKKYSREILAEKSNLSANYIYEIENGNYVLGCIPIINLCNALETTPTELLSDFITTPQKLLQESLSTELSNLSKKNCEIILTMIKMMQSQE